MMYPPSICNVEAAPRNWRNNHLDSSDICQLSSPWIVAGFPQARLPNFQLILEIFDSSLDDNTGKVSSVIGKYKCIVEHRGQNNIPVVRRPGEETTTEQLTVQFSRSAASRSTCSLYTKRHRVRSHILHFGRWHRRPSRPEASQCARGLHIKQLGVHSHVFHLGR